MSLIPSLSRKIYTADTIAEQVNNWHKSETIVFTNGCFDILHLGHIDYLNRSAQLGSKLVVGLNTDASVRKIKGENRPIQDENSRLNILAALECVDAVVLFDEETPLELIKVVKPDVLVKGADYEIEQIVGAKEVKEYGGEVKTIAFLEGYSTSNIVKTTQKWQRLKPLSFVKIAVLKVLSGWGNVNRVMSGIPS